MEDPIHINGAFFRCPERSANTAGLTARTLCNWSKAEVTGYGYPLTTIDYRGHRLIEERNLLVIAAVQKAFPVPKGRIPGRDKVQMRDYATTLHTLFVLVCP